MPKLNILKGNIILIMIRGRNREKVMENKKRIFFMRHGNLKKANDLEKMTNYEFMEFILNRMKPSLAEYCNIKRIPPKIDIIYHSDNLGAKQTAALIRNRLNNKPIVDDSLKHLLSEVKFSTNILPTEEFRKIGDIEKLRNTILEKWIYDDEGENFIDSINRVIELDKFLRKVPFKNILLITHGLYLT